MLYVNVTSVESYISPDRISIYLSSEPPSPALQLSLRIMDGVTAKQGRQAAHLEPEILEDDGNLQNSPNARASYV
ncbi:unnamed protein product [Sphagnum troendelagicum]|uniref:Uncharacterized protein n=1 Tax=Sphagnum troendelagicum TaxID=128251 RepID=A0ABP0UPL9_9BRYO